MITRLRVKNYRCFEDFDWNPDQICLLIGQNGTGKSTLFGLLEGLRLMLQGDRSIESLFNPQSIFRATITGAVVQIRLDISHSGANFVYELKITFDEAFIQTGVFESLTREGESVIEAKDGEVLQTREGLPVEFSLQPGNSVIGAVRDLEGENSLKSFREALQGLFTFFPNPARIKSIGDAQLHLRLKSDASNLIGWLRSKESFDAATFSRFEHELKELLPGLQKLSFSQVDLDTRLKLNYFEAQANFGYELDFGELSDGQKVLVALCALIWLRTPPPAVMLLDEPENFLALAEVQPLIHALLDAAQENGTQLIIASHHPELFNELAKDYGIVLSRGEDGRIGWKRFKDVEEYGLSPAEVIARGWELN